MKTPSGGLPASNAISLGMDAAYQDAALVLVGHGSLSSAESCVPIYQHADALRAMDLFAEVQECFWKLEPSISGVLRSVFSPRVFVLPLFMCDGYFTDEVVPRELGFPVGEAMDRPRTLSRGHQKVSYCRPVGTHTAMTQVVLARAGEILDRYPFPVRPSDSKVSLCVAGHGTGSHENSRRAIEDHVKRIAKLNRFADVHAVFMEEAPRIGECYSLAKADHIVVVPFVVSEGLHATQDIPVMLGESESIVKKRRRRRQSSWRNPRQIRGKRVWYTPSVGTDPRVPSVILERVWEAAKTC